MPKPLHLVLLGGGHAMLPSLVDARDWTSAGIRVTLVDPHRWLYYSGMVPEYLGGVYEESQVRIDLAEHAQRNGVQFIQQRATGLDPNARNVRIEDGDEISYDVLAVDVGGANPAVPRGVVSTKPISRVRELEPMIREALGRPDRAFRLVIVGGGAAGVEVALNITGRFAGADRIGDLDLTVVEQHSRLLPDFPESMGHFARERLLERGASIACNASVRSVNPGSDETVVRMQRRNAPDRHVHTDVVLWATGTVGPSLLQNSPLPTDADGFLQVTPQLRSPSYPRIFGAGDCTTLLDASLEKVGVHAVKQGPDLRENLDRTLRGLHKRQSPPPARDLVSFRPYRVVPLILSTGAQTGLWTAGDLWIRGTPMLRIKHWIDRRWMRSYAPDAWANAPWTELVAAEAAMT